MAFLSGALLICSAMGCNFYSRCVKSGIIDKISEFLGISDKHMALFLSVLGVLAAIPVTAILIADFSKIVVEAFKRSPILLDDEKQGKMTTVCTAWALQWCQGTCCKHYDMQILWCP